MGIAIESALVILAREAEALVKPFRHQYDPSAAQGMPAHFTVLYPFKPPQELTAAILDRLYGLFAQFPPFIVSLTELRRFPQVLYLAPVPDQPIKQIIRVISEQFPETPPYRGALTDILPHLTIARLPDLQRLEDIAADFQRVAHGRLPLSVSVSEVALMDNAQKGLWRVQATFRLGRT